MNFQNSDKCIVLDCNKDILTHLVGQCGYASSISIMLTCKIFNKTIAAIIEEKKTRARKSIKFDQPQAT